MVSRTRRTILRISTPPRVPSPGEAHSGGGSSRPPSQAVREEEVHVENVPVPDVPISEAPVPPHNDRTRERTHATSGRSRASRSVRSGSRMTMMNDFMARMMEMQLETQQQLKEMHTNSQQQIREIRVELARSQKKPMEDEGRSETPSLPQRPPMPMGPSSSRPPVFQQQPPPPQNPVTSTPPVPPTTTPVSFRAPVYGGNGTGSGGETMPSRNLEVGEGSTLQQAKPSAWQVEKFLKNGGGMFAGNLDPEEANEWLITTRGVFESMDCPMELWVRIATGAFKGKARTWWDSAKKVHFQGKAPKDIAWEEFQVVFDDMYFPPEEKRKRELDFEHLQQKGMSVAEYLAKFISLERFAPGLVANEKT